MKKIRDKPRAKRPEPRSNDRLVDLETWIFAEYERLEYRLHALLGRRALTIALLALVLGLTTANVAALSAMASALEEALNIRNAAYGMISSASALAGAVMILPVGVLVDRRSRVPLLTGLTFLWSIGMALSGFIRGYNGLLITQVLAGISGVAVAAPVASLAGDYFPPSQRGRIFGLIVGGEMVGAGAGLLLTSLLMEAYSWRAAFWGLALAGVACGVLVIRFLHEPERGGMTSISRDSIAGQSSGPPAARRRVSALVESRNIAPHTGRIIRDDPTHWPWIQAARYILTVRTNLILLTASTAGYFYFTGLLTFAVLYLMARYRLGSADASLLVLVMGSGTVPGVLLGGWLGDWLLSRRIVAARAWVAAGAFFVAVVGFLPALLLPNLAPASVFFFLAALGLGATDPLLDAARLDIMHSRLWGRAESLRNALRYAGVAVSPYVFGLASDLLEPRAASRSATGLQETFLFMLVILLISCAAMVVAALTYPRDVATAIASEHSSAGAVPSSAKPSA